MHLVIDYVHHRLGLFNQTKLDFIEIDREALRLPEQLKALLEDQGVTVQDLVSVTISTKDARFSDVRAALVVAKTIQLFTNIPVFIHEEGELTHESLLNLIQTTPRTTLQAEYSAPASITPAK